ncbi:MAG: hypothetical protein ACPGUD_01580 [Parashewanella sp.]
MSTRDLLLHLLSRLSPNCLAAERQQIKALAYQEHAHQLLFRWFEKGVFQTKIADLYFAIKQSWPEEVITSMLACCHFDINQSNGEQSLFSCALEHHRTDLLIPLILAGIDVNNPRGDGSSLAKIASDNGLTQKLKTQLLIQKAAEPNIIHALLILKCTAQELDQILQTKQGPSTELYNLEKTRNGYSAIQVAWKHQVDVQVINTLITHSVSSLEPIFDGKNIKEHLRDAKRWQDLQILLWNHACEIQLTDLHAIIIHKWGNELFTSALKRYINQSSIETASAELHKKIQGKSLPEVICEGNNEKALNTWFDCGLPFPVDKNSNQTLLHKAIQISKLSIIQIILSNGGNSELYSCAQGTTPLHLGMNNPHLDVVIHLFTIADQLALKTLRNQSGETPYQIACNNKKMLFCLLKLIKQNQAMRESLVLLETTPQPFNFSLPNELNVEQIELLTTTSYGSLDATLKLLETNKELSRKLHDRNNSELTELRKTKQQLEQKVLDLQSKLDTLTKENPLTQAQN